MPIYEAVLEQAGFGKWKYEEIVRTGSESIEDWLAAATEAGNDLTETDELDGCIENQNRDLGLGRVWRQDMMQIQPFFYITWEK